jgi:crossover junction endonuclease EME1
MESGHENLDSLPLVDPKGDTKTTRCGPSATKNEDFLFLSDDFDTTVDLTSSAAAKPNSSAAARAAKSPNSRPLGRTASATIAARSGSDQPLHASSLKRWNTVADPIDRVSSPVLDLTGDKDPFASSSPARDHTRLRKTNLPTVPKEDDPFASSPPKKETAQPLATRSSPRLRQRASQAAAILEIDSSPVSRPPIQKVPRSKTAWDPISSSIPDPCTRDDDPFASSPPQRQKGKAREVPVRKDGEIDPFASPPAQNSKRKIDAISLSGSDAFNSEEEFPDIENVDPTKARSEVSKKKAFQLEEEYGLIRKTKKLPALSKTHPQKARKTSEECAAEKARKLEDKERKAEEKQEAKRLKALDKEKEKALAEVNKLRTDKKVSTPEMIVDLPASLTPAVSLQITELLKDLEVQHTSWHSPVENVVKWRRKVNSTFNEDLGYWVPVPAHVESEDHIMVIVTASAFVNMALGQDGLDLNDHVSRLQRHFNGNKIIYLIEGLTPWLRKNRNLRNRQFVSAVRDAGEGSSEAQPPPPPSSQPKRRKNAAAAAQVIDEDGVEDALLSLQVEHGVLIHHTNMPVETAHWVATFTQQISTIPGRRARDASAASAGFCMESGQVRTGDGPKDTYIRMLQEITRVTAPIAYGIVAEFPSVSKLVKGLEENGPLALENCRKSANKDGAFTDRAVGQAISKRLHKIFTGTDAARTDI